MQEIMKGLPRGTFDRLVQEQQADKHSKGFGCWDQLVAMVYGHLSGASSLRQLESGFNSQSNHHYHLGTGLIRRSTLAEANSRRQADVFEQTARQLMSQARRHVRQESQQLLYLLDSTSITLKGPGFDAWTQDSRTRNTQGIKLHMLYAAHEHVPVQHSFSAANVNDIAEGVKLPIERGATYVFDKGYCDYNGWASIDVQGAHFVTRFKYNAALRVDKSHPIAAQDSETILDDQIVRIQILCALISYLLLALYKKTHGFTGSLWALLGELRSTLFQRPLLDVERYRKRRLQQQTFAALQPGLFA